MEKVVIVVAFYKANGQLLEVGQEKVSNLFPQEVAEWSIWGGWGAESFDV